MLDAPLIEPGGCHSKFLSTITTALSLPLCKFDGVSHVFSNSFRFLDTRKNHLEVIFPHGDLLVVHMEFFRILGLFLGFSANPTLVVFVPEMDNGKIFRNPLSQPTLVVPRGSLIIAGARATCSRI